MLDLAEAVDFFDEYDPVWRDKIDLDTLDMNDPKKCVIAQVTGEHFIAGKDVMGIEMTMEWGLDFEIGTDQYEVDFSNECWKQIINGTEQRYFEKEIE